MTPIFRSRGVWAATGLAAVLALSACDNKTTDSPAAVVPPAEAPASSTPGEKLDSAIANTQQAASQAQSDASAAGSRAADAVSAGGNAVSQAVDDATITATVSAGLAKDPDLSALKIDVDTKSGAVTLTGPAPSDVAKARAEQIAKSVNGVSSVMNNLEVRAN